MDPKTEWHSLSVVLSRGLVQIATALNSNEREYDKRMILFSSALVIPSDIFLELRTITSTATAQPPPGEYFTDMLGLQIHTSGIVIKQAEPPNPKC